MKVSNARATILHWWLHASVTEFLSAYICYLRMDVAKMLLLLFICCLFFLGDRDLEEVRV